jgi:hypothetical protein
MSQPSKGNRKQIAGRLPLEVHEAFEARRAKLGLGQNDALISAIKRWSRDDPPSTAVVEPPAPKPRAHPAAQPRAAAHVKLAAPRVRGFDPKTGEPIYG